MPVVASPDRNEIRQQRVSRLRQTAIELGDGNSSQGVALELDRVRHSAKICKPVACGQIEQLDARPRPARRRRDQPNAVTLIHRGSDAAGVGRTDAAPIDVVRCDLRVEKHIGQCRRFRCRECKRGFNERTGTPLNRLGFPE